MAPNVLRCTPTDADLLDRSGIITASVPSRRQVETALGDEPESTASRGVHRSGFASMAVTALMLIVAIGAIVNRELPAPSDVAVGEQRQPAVVSAPPAAPPRPSSTPAVEPRQEPSKPAPKPKSQPQPPKSSQPPPARQVVEQPEEPVNRPEPVPSQPKLEHPEPDLGAGRSFTEKVRDLIAPAIEGHEHEHWDFGSRREHRQYGDPSEFAAYAQRWHELLSPEGW